MTDNVRHIVSCTVPVVYCRPIYSKVVVVGMAMADGWRQGAGCLDLRMLSSFPRLLRITADSWLAVVSSLLAVVARRLSHRRIAISLPPIIAAVARTLEPSDLTLTCC